MSYRITQTGLSRVSCSAIGTIFFIGFVKQLTKFTGRFVGCHGGVPMYVGTVMVDYCTRVCDSPSNPQSHTLDRDWYPALAVVNF